MTSEYPTSFFGLVTVFGCTIFRRKKAGIPGFDYPWQGPYLTVSVLSDTTYRIQRRRVIHAGRLKPYLGPALRSWILKVQV